MNKTELNALIEWLTKEHSGGMLCKCGDFACHNAIHCKSCGTEFKYVKSTTIENLIRRKSTYRGHKNAIRWFVAIHYRLLRDFHKINYSEEVIQKAVNDYLS